MTEVAEDVLLSMENEVVGLDPYCLTCQKQITGDTFSSVFVNDIFYVFHDDCWQGLLLNHYAERIKDSLTFGKMVQ